MDHKPNSKEERERIEAAGGVVVWAGTWRVGGVLAVSRAFGDKPLKRFVISDPHIQEEQLQRGDEFVILASDGLWDVLTNEVRTSKEADGSRPVLSSQNQNCSLFYLRKHFPVGRRKRWRWSGASRTWRKLPRS